MAATACAYGYQNGCRPAIMAPFDGDGGGRCHHRCSVVHGDGVVVQQPPPAPPPPPPPPLPPPIWHRHPGLCTEGLGSESSESSGDLDIAGIMADDDHDIEQDEDEEDAGHCIRRQLPFDGQGATPQTPATRRTRAFPPPISVIGAAGKPWQYLRAHRGGGRLVLREVRIPSRELLHACRQDGRLKLHFAFAHPDEQHHLVDDDQELNN